MIGKLVESAACVFILLIIGVMTGEVEDEALVDSEYRLDSATEVEVAIANGVNSVEEQGAVSINPVKLMVIIGSLEIRMIQI